MRSSPSGPPDWLTERPYAHRGLHGPGRPENSRAAFEAAIAAGFGIELDVQVTRDGAAMVFHDYELGRLTQAQGRVDGLSAAALAEISLAANGEPIPSLAEILDLIGGRVPLLVEVKNPRGKVDPFCHAVADALNGYSGAVAVMSFNPHVPAWFAAHRPRQVRGLVVTEHGKSRLRGWFERRLSLLRARADFLAYDVRDLASPLPVRIRSRGTPVLTWTVRSPEDEAAAAAYADQIIHEIPRFQ